MNASLKPYPRYKDAGVPWIGSIPNHWDVLKLRHILQQRTIRNRADLPLLSVVREKGVILRDIASKDENHNFIPDDLSNYKVVRQGQFAMNKMKAWQGSYGISQFDGIVSPAYFVFDLRGVSPDYFHLAIRSRAYVPFFAAASGGVRIGQWDSSLAQMREIPFLAPSSSEQDAMVRYADYIDRRIRRYIRVKQQLIKLLEEQKQAIIHQAVTGQIDVRTGKPYPAYKESGVEWLGQVPVHWHNSRVKNEFLCLDRRRVPLSGMERGSMTLRLYDYYGASGVIDKVDDYLFDDELLLIAEDGANLVLRNLPLALIARGKFWVNNHAHILKPRRGNIEYLAAVLESLNYQPWISGAAQPKLTQDRLMSIAIAVPDHQEQDEIMATVSLNTRGLTAAIEKGQREIALLREYRTRLIADVVTGKLDVREAAANLPDEAEEPELLEYETLIAEEDRAEGIAAEEAVLEEVEV